MFSVGQCENAQTQSYKTVVQRPTCDLTMAMSTSSKQSIGAVDGYW